MKRIMAIIITIILALCGCSSNQHKYTEKLDGVTEKGTVSYYTAEELVKDYVVRDEKNTKYLDYVKKQLLQFKQLDEFASLNWEAFNGVKSIYWLDAEKVRNLPEGVDISGWDAAYSKELSGIIFFPEISLYSEDQQFHVTTHELCHALLESKREQKKNAFVIEGEVELLALIFSTSLGMHPEPTYPNGVLTAAWLNELFGDEKIREAIINDNLDSVIDEIAGDNACHRINIGGNMAESGTDATTGRNAEIEVLCHISRELGKTSAGERWLEEFAGTFDDVDIRYFMSILSS